MDRRFCWRHVTWAELAQGSDGAAVGKASGGGESDAACRGVLDDLVARGLRTREFLIIDGAAGLEKALAALWDPVAWIGRRTWWRSRRS